MVDKRFHKFAGPELLGTLLTEIGVAASMPDPSGPMIFGAEELGLASAEHVSLATHGEYRDALRATQAGAVVVSRDLADDVPDGTVAVVVAHPHAVFVDLLDRLYPHSTSGALLGQREGEALTEDDVRLGAGVVVGPDVEIGRGTTIGANTVIGQGVTIGRNCTIGANVTIECAHLGNGVVIHSGARIGSEGFGWLDIGRSNRKIPQLGRVIVQDRVEIGANSTVDRGALGDTVIGEGTKIDNLVQIGHNCRIGRNCLLAGMVGLAGSTILEDSVMMGAGSGAAGHLTIGRGSVLAGRAGVTKSLPPGSRVAGFPAEDGRVWLRQQAILRRMSKRGESGH